MTGLRHRSAPAGGAAAGRLVRIVVLVLATAAARSWAAAAIVLDAARDGESIDIRASVEVAADARTAWRVLTDYDRYTEFIPGLRVSRVVARRGTTVTVRQSGDALLWQFRWPLDITFEIDEDPPTGLQSRAVAGSLRGLSSRYLLTPTAAGVRLDYVGRVAPGFELFGRFEQFAVERNVARQFQALADEIERKGARAGGAATPGGP